MDYLNNLFVLLFALLIASNNSLAKTDIDICGHTNGVDLSALDLINWDLTHINSTDNSAVDYNINICSPISHSSHKECTDSYICKYSRKDNRAMGFKPKNVNIESETESKVRSMSVLFEGPECDLNPNTPNYTLNIRFICGPHLEYPQLFWDNKCQTHMIWRTYAVCKEKPVQSEVKCYVYDKQGLRRDLTPLIRPKGRSYKVMSQTKEFYINVCSGVSDVCPENDTGACLGIGPNKYEKVGDFRYNTLEFKSNSAVIPYGHIEMTYKTKSKACTAGDGTENISKTTIRFICPPKHQKRSIDFADRYPKLVSDLDCDYQIEWLTEYACPLKQIQVSPTTCQLSEEVHGLDFNLKSLLKRNANEFYKIENISINNTKTQSLYEIDFNVCGGLGAGACGDQKWSTIAVCLKSNDKSIKDRAIGLTTEGSLRLADNKFLLEYRNKESDCKFGDNTIAEKTIIEFVCDDSKGLGFIGKPEFVSLEDCTYTILWKTALVCPAISSNTSCVTTYKNMTFDLSLLRKGVGSDPWIAGVSQALPWSRHSKDEKDRIYLNICGLLPKTVETTECDERSSACMRIASSNTTLSLGQFSSSPKHNEDINAIELIYENGFDSRNNKKIKSKFTLRCKPGDLDSDPILVDVDQESGVYYFEWETSAACPINVFVGNDCQVYDQFLDYTFDLSPLKSRTPYLIKTDEYDYRISVCGEVTDDECNDSKVTKAVGPYGACQVEKGGQKRAFSLGKSNQTLTYWNGVINLTLTDGTPYNNAEKTPRKSQIAFICDPNIGNGSPEYDGETNRSYFFRWYTSLACPHSPKIVHCVWDNGSHILDLTQLAMSSGNHFTVGLSSHTNVPYIYYINICRPLNPIHDISLKGCGANSAVCKVSLGSNQSVLSLGEATHPPISGFDGSVNLLYENGSPCPTNPKKSIRTRIKFECDRQAGLSSPIVYEPGSELTDSEECVYLFEWRTSAVCEVIEPTKVDNNLCLYTDPRTGLSVDLSPLKRQPTQEHYKVALRQSQSMFDLNVCGLANSFASSQCTKSAVCLMTNQSDKSYVNYGLLTSSSFFFDGTHLKLKYFNGSKCSAHSDSGRMSSEIIFKCNADAKNSSPKLHSIHACIAVFEWETDLVCGLELPKCSVVSDNKFYNLRQLSTISHAWNTTDRDGNLYLLNVCTKLPTSADCKGLNAAACLCAPDANNQMICSQSLGDPSADELSVLSNGDLLLTYRNGDEEQCVRGMRAQTQITFKCGETTGKPKFIEFVKQKCVYKFEWKTFMACAVNDRNDTLLAKENGYIYDERIDAYINIGPLISKSFNVTERRVQNNSIDFYTYVINLSKAQLASDDSECSKSAVCQTKPNEKFNNRDIGSTEAIKYILRGHELQIILHSLGPQKCGKRSNKNVSTIIRLQCSTHSGLGSPVFVYESNDCDYTFDWQTEWVCPNRFITKAEFDSIPKAEAKGEVPVSSDIPESKSSSHTSIWIGVIIVVLLIVTLVFLVFYKQKFRQSLMFRFRRLFGPETSNHTFHYHQLASYEKDRQTPEVMIIDCNDAHNTIAAQPSTRVPYYSIYDDSDVDLLT